MFRSAHPMLPRPVLPLEHVRNPAMDLGSRRNHAGKRGNVGLVSRVGVELTNLGRLRKVIGEELGGMGDGAKGNAVGNHASSSGRQQHELGRISVIRHSPELSGAQSV